jgi:hypothetical protein
MRRAAKVDDNQTEIVKRLRKIGVSVEIIGKPLDLLICHRGVTSLAEVKNLDGRNRHTEAQIDFRARWPGKIYTFTSPDQAAAEVLGPEVMK